MGAHVGKLNLKWPREECLFYLFLCRTCKFSMVGNIQNKKQNKTTPPKTKNKTVNERAKEGLCHNVLIETTQTEFTI